MITRNKNPSFSKQIIDLFLVILFAHLNCWSNEVRSADTTTTSKISAFVLELKKVFWQNFSAVFFSYYTLYFSSFYDKHFSWVMKYGKVRKKLDLLSSTNPENGRSDTLWDYRYLAEKLNESVRIPYSWQLFQFLFQKKCTWPWSNLEFITT